MYAKIPRKTKVLHSRFVTADVFHARLAHFMVWVYPEGSHVAVAVPVVTA